MWLFIPVFILSPLPAEGKYKISKNINFFPGNYLSSYRQGTYETKKIEKNIRREIALEKTCVLMLKNC